MVTLKKNKRLQIWILKEKQSNWKRTLKTCVRHIRKKHGKKQSRIKYLSIYLSLLSLCFWQQRIFEMFQASHQSSLFGWKLKGCYCSTPFLSSRSAWAPDPVALPIAGVKVWQMPKGAFYLWKVMQVTAHPYLSLGRETRRLGVQDHHTVEVSRYA